MDSFNDELSRLLFCRTFVALYRNVAQHLYCAVVAKHFDMFGADGSISQRSHIVRSSPSLMLSM